MEVSNEQKLIFADCILSSIKRSLETDPSSICYEVYGLGGLAIRDALENSGIIKLFKNGSK